MKTAEEEKNWSKPVDGVIHIPDELDPLIVSMMNQYGFHKHSRLFGPQEMVCRMAYIAQKFFKNQPAPAKEGDWNEIERIIVMGIANGSSIGTIVSFIKSKYDLAPTAAAKTRHDKNSQI